MNLSSKDWMLINDFIRSLLSQVSEGLDDESIESIEHYLDHDEYEMAFEGLFLEIMKLQLNYKIDYEKSMETALLLNLHKESVFDADFWQKFEKFIVEKRNV